MAKCEICGKGTSFGHNVSHSVRRTKRTFKANIRNVRVVQNGTARKMKICARCLRSNKLESAV
ncbi:MAG: 50S ribosomal protein L28 [Clostridia bacterium]|jgi:large subunit ribosomal protein L28|nr:50S ribosomal protein L28 [Clostridiaceae bacterium]